MREVKIHPVGHLLRNSSLLLVYLGPLGSYGASLGDSRSGSTWVLELFQFFLSEWV